MTWTPLIKLRKQVRTDLGRQTRMRINSMKSKRWWISLAEKEEQLSEEVTRRSIRPLTIRRIQTISDKLSLMLSQAEPAQSSSLRLFSCIQSPTILVQSNSQSDAINQAWIDYRPNTTSPLLKQIHRYSLHRSLRVSRSTCISRSTHHSWASFPMNRKLQLPD